MKLYSGKQTIAKFRDTTVFIDFDRLFQYRGEKKSRIILEKNIGKFLMSLTIISFLFILILLILSGELIIIDILLVKNIKQLSLFLLIIPFIYSLYLLRDREEEAFETNLSSIGNYKKNYLELNKVFTASIVGAIDYFYYHYNNVFLNAFTDYIINHPINKYLIEKRLGIDTKLLRENTHKSFQMVNVTFDAVYTDLFVRAFNEGIKLEVDRIDESIFMFVLFKYYLSKVLLDLGITDLEQEGFKVWFKNEKKKQNYFHVWKDLSKFKPSGDVNKAFTSRKTPILDAYGEDFTKSATKGDFVITIGKENEMQQVLQNLQRESNSTIMILGDPGVGKTKFIRHLATRMVAEDVPKVLQDYRLVVVDLNKVFTKTSSIEAFKQTIQSMLDEVKFSGNIILVFEEIAQILNIREEGKLEVVNLLINSLNSSKIPIIATTTPSNYSKFIRPIAAFASIFEVIKLPEPSSNIALQILIDEASRIEKKYGIDIQVNALKRIVEFAPKFDYDRVMPDKGIALLEEATVNAVSKGLKYLDSGVVDELLSKKLGVNVGYISQKEAQILQNLETEMHKRVIGQNEAITAVVSAIKRSRSGLTNSKKPIASFLFFGPTGVGKTEVAKTLAALYYGDEKFMVRLDMSEYQEQQNLGRLIGYTDDKGNFVGGYLTEAVRSKPFCLILLDEIEKANKKVLDLFLQVLDEGSLTDGAGRRIDFTNTIIIATSNAGSREIANLVSKGHSYVEVLKEVMNNLREVFRIEFLNRFDRVIMFRPLNRIEIEQIVDIMMREVKLNTLNKGIDISWNERTLLALADKGYNTTYGARELRRIVQEEIEDKLADLIIQGKIKTGNEVIFNGMQVSEIKE